jgi:hypothetical protein
MTEFMNGKEITFRQHILDIKYFTEMVHDFDCIVKTELTLFDKSFGRIDANRDAFAVMTRFLCECFDILEVTNCVGQELLLILPYRREYIG